MKTVRSLVPVLIAAALLAPRQARAQAPAPKALVVTAHNLTAEGARGDAAQAPARPGDVIRYGLVFTNVTKGPVKNVMFDDPLPQGLVYVLGSAKADQPVRIDYSIDGGKTYSAQPMIAVLENGKQVEKPAPPARYTHVRWMIVGSVAPGAEVRAEFRAQVTQAPGEAQ
jgi:uncharacterized repeat protein (TIGR01451 family)